MAHRSYAKRSKSEYNVFRIFAYRVAVLFLTLSLCNKFKVRVYGRENMPPASFGSYILTSNHVTAYDPPLVSVATAYHPVAYMAKEELFEHFWGRLFYDAVGTFAVNRQKLELATIKTAKAVLETEKWALGIFPEGTRNQDKTVVVKTLKKGAPFLSKATQKPILPVGICWRDAHTAENPSAKKEVIIRIGTMIPVNDDVDALAEQLQDALIALATDRGD